MAAPKDAADALFDSAPDASSADALFDAAPGADVGYDPGSPLAKALASQTGEVVDVETPGGPAQFTRSGQRFYGAKEHQELLSAQEPVLRERMLSGALSVLSGGGPMIDEMNGTVAATKGFWKWAADKLAGTPDRMRAPSPADTFNRTADATQSDVDRATREASPNVDVFGMQVPVLPVVGAAIPAMLGGSPATLAGRFGLGGAAGAGSGFFGSRGRLSDGGGAQVAQDSAMGGGIGLVGAGVAEIPGAAMRGGTNLMNRGAMRQTMNDTNTAAADAASARGVAGSAGSAVQRGIEYVDAVLASPGDFSPQQVMLAQRLSSDPAIEAARQRVAENAMMQLRSNIAWQQQTAQEAGDLMSSIPQRAAAATNDALGNPYSTALLPRAQRFATRSAVGAAGVAVGDATGGAVAAAPGAVQMAINMIHDPRLQFAVGRDISRVMTPFSQPGVAAMTGQAAVAAQKNAYQTLKERWGIDAKSKEELADEAFLKGQSQP